MIARSHRRQRQSRGFSLLEVLVAFVILALVLGTLMQIFSGGLRSVGRASEYQRAVLFAQSKLATMGIETAIKEGEESGEFDKTFRWQTSIKPFQEPPSETVDASGALKPVLPVTLMEVEIRVQWGDTMQPYSLSMKTMRLANKVTL
jgi:general secretion pathway protein I